MESSSTVCQYSKKIKFYDVNDEDMYGHIKWNGHQMEETEQKQYQSLTESENRILELL